MLQKMQEGGGALRYHSTCLRCAHRPEFAAIQDFFAHAKLVHGLSGQAMVHKRVDRHLNGDGWGQTEYTWLIEDVAWCYEEIRFPRSMDDLTFWTLEVAQ